MGKDKQIEQLLYKLKQGEIDILSAIGQVGGDIRDCGSAKLDLDRGPRCGFPEFIYGAGKSIEQLLTIIPALLDEEQPVLITRLDNIKAQAVTAAYPQAQYDERAGTVLIQAPNAVKQPGKVAIVTAGTSDLGVALEAKYTAELCGVTTDLFTDVGVAGLHRLLQVSPRLRESDVVIVIAGMEGALPSVVGGLVKVPVIAVPTSVGYGAALHGITALLGMLTSCASGVTVVNIDNGFGAACAAVRMLSLKKS